MSGDVDLIARITAVQPINGDTAGGVMIRDSLTPNAAHASMLVTAGNGGLYVRRPAGGGFSSNTVVSSLASPFWLKLELRADLVTAFISPDGMTWATVGTVRLSLPASYYVGLAATSHDALGTATVVFDSVLIRPPSPKNQPPTIALTGPDTSTSYTAPASVTISAAASDADGTVRNVDFFEGSTFLGTSAAPPYAYTWTNVPEGSYTFSAVAHDNSGAATTSDTRSITVTPPPNQDPTVTLTAPANGATFTAPATVTVSATASDSDGTVSSVSFYAGTTLLGTDTSSPYSVTWSNVGAGTYSLTAVATDNDSATTTSAARTITVNAANQAPTVGLTAPANGATLTAPATVTVSATASDSDGTVSSVSFYAGTTLIGTDTSSPYDVTWNNVASGTYSLTAVATDNDSSTTTSTARTITVTAANQAPTVELTAPVNGATFTAPATITVSATATDTDGAITQVDFYAGTMLIGSDDTSPYNVSWANVPQGTYSLTAIATDSNGASIASAARTITVTGGLPAGWTGVDVGAPAVAGSSQYASGTYTLDGAGEVVGTADQFHFVYRQMTGDVVIQARVTSVEPLHPWTKAGVMVRETLAANAAMGLMFVSASSGSGFHQRLTTGASRVFTAGTAVAAPYWVRLARMGTTLTASQSSDGVSWTVVGTMSVSPSPIYVGLAVASSDTTQAATGTFDGVQVTTPAPNQAPTVGLTAPANGATFTAPATVTVSATASDSDGTVSSVSFYAGTTLIGTDTSSPYSVTWNDVAAGTYSLTAVATDNDSATTTSAARSITVNAAPPPPDPRHAVFTASADHDTLVSRYQLEIFNAGADPNVATPVAARDLGKPAVVNGECDVDITQTVNGLAPGSYFATVSAVGSSGSSRSNPAPFTR